MAAASYAVVFRHRTATAAQCRWACQWAEHQAQLHKPYDFNSAARVGISNHTNLGRLIVVETIIYFLPLRALLVLCGKIQTFYKFRKLILS